MKLKSLPFGVVITAVILTLGIPLTAEAQFLKKLSQGLEKVNKTLDKVEKTTGKRSGQQQPTQPQGSQKATSNANSEIGMEAVTPSYRHPFLTSRTRYLDVPGFNYNISDVYDGIFAVNLR